MGAAEPDGAIKDTGIELQMALESLRQIVCTGWERPLAWATLRGAGGLDEAVSMDRRLRASKVEPAIAVLAPGGEDVGHEAGHYFVGDARQGRGQLGGSRRCDVVLCIVCARKVADLQSRGPKGELAAAAG